MITEYVIDLRRAIVENKIFNKKQRTFSDFQDGVLLDI